MQADLVGIRYEQLLPFALPYQNPENAFRVISGDFVIDDGTGMYIQHQLLVRMKSSERSKTEVPPLLVLDESTPVPLVDLQGKFHFTW
jgi:isoleucyl-tRNA synthetase